MIYDLIFIQYVTWPKVIDRVNGESMFRNLHGASNTQHCWGEQTLSP